jgi:C1A family cysteine protease
MHHYRNCLSRRSVVAGIAASTLSPWRSSTASTPFYARGGRLLPGIQHRVQAQNALASRVNEILKSDLGYMSAVSADHPLVARSTELPKEWRTSAAPAKNQETCGSCFVFAAIGAFEESYNKFYHEYPHVSVQEALDCTYGDDNCAVGGHHETVLLYLQLYGLADAQKYSLPYKDIKQSCTTNVPRSYWLANWGYVESADPKTLIPSDDAIKRAIVKYGAVATMVNTGLPSKSPPRDAITWPDYTGGVFPGIPSSSYEPLEIDHDVLLVGWKDTDASGKGYWIIRNSWGEQWGGDNKGFIYLPYHCNNIGCTAAWVLPWAPVPLNPALIAKLGLPANFNARLQ